MYPIRNLGPVSLTLPEDCESNSIEAFQESKYLTEKISMQCMWKTIYKKEWSKKTQRQYSWRQTVWLKDAAHYTWTFVTINFFAFWKVVNMKIISLNIE